MAINYMSKLSTRLFIPLIIVFVLVLLVLIIYVPSVTREHTVNAAISSAEETVKQYKAIRSYYTKNIINKVLAGTEIKPHYNHRGKDNTIPLPATFIHDLSKLFSDKNLITLKLYSPYPFPNRSNRTLDSFGQQAWNALKKDSRKSFSKVDTINSKKVMRVALSDIMTQQDCVNCHNTHPETPKRDWKLNDIRGILEVQVPIDEQLNNASSLNITITLIVLFALSATTGLLFFMFRQLISNRLRNVHSVLQDITDGDGYLSKRLDENPHDEIGVIAIAFNHFIEQLENTLSIVNIQVHQINCTKKNMKVVTTDVKNNNAHQQELTDQVAQAMSDMMVTTQEMANITTSAAENTQRTHEKTEEGRRIIAENMSSFEHLSNNIHEASEVVNNIETNSQNIVGVLDIIHGITEQINLLALSTTTEAARADEQGRGFAVVADEIRTLASKTQESTKEINKTIEQLQTSAKNAVETLEKGNKSIKISYDKTSKTNTMINDVGNAITEIQAQNLQIATAIEEQACVSEEINQNINKISDVTASTDSSTQELLIIAEEINTAVSNISQQLDRFTKN